MMFPMSENVIAIKELTKKGYGKSDDIKGDILSSIPGEKGVVRTITGKGKRSLHILEEILERSVDRTSPRCVHFTSCGGCSFQHIAYSRQLADKQKKIQSLFPSYHVEEIQGLEDPWHYRNKMEYTFSQNKTGQKFLGLIKPKSQGYVENLSECFIVDPWFSTILIRVRNFWQLSAIQAYSCRDDSGSFQTLTLRMSRKTGSKMAILTVSGNSEYALSKKNINDFVKAIGDDQCAIFIRIKCISKGSPTRYYEMNVAGPDCFEEQLLGTTFMMSPQAFFQPNPFVADKFFSTIINKLDLKGSEKVLDLFSGIGTISMLLSKYVKHIVAVEICKAAVCDARANIEDKDMNNIEIYADDVSHFVDGYGKEFTPDIVIIDPPRCGMGKVAISFLEKILPDKIVYLSCNPTTQKEDIDLLLSYKISSIHPFDQFPHTPHIENLIFLEKK